MSVKLQGTYGFDARYTHYLGEFNYTLDTRNQFDIVEANVTVPMPVLTAGGIKGFFVAASPGNFDFVNSEVGRPATVVSAPKPTTYGR